MLSEYLGHSKVRIKAWGLGFRLGFRVRVLCAFPGAGCRGQGLKGYRAIRPS